MKDRDASTGDCRVDPNYSGSFGLKAWLSRDALDPGGAAPTVGGVALPASQPGANNLSLSFSAGSATFTLDSTDVGKYGLNFRDDTSGFARDTGGNPRPIAGGSAALTLRPFGFRVSGVPLYTSPTSASPSTAGAGFGVTVQAVAWQAGDDANNDGIPDGHGDTTAGNDADLSDNAPVASFAWATSLSAVAPIAPSGGTVGALGGATTVPQGSFAGGQASLAGVQYSEVGAFTLYMNANGYLGTSGADSFSRSPLIGRFIPGQFLFTTVTNACTAATTPFSYSGEPLQQVVVVAANLSGGTTLNYTGSFAKDGTFSSPDTGVVVSQNIALTAVSFSNGQATLTGTGSSPTAPALAFSNPETAPLDPAHLTLTDSDGVSGTAGGVRLVSGRLAIDSAVGSELLDLKLPVRVEYYSGSTNGWIPNTDDACTVAGDLNTNFVANGVGTSVGATALSNGNGSLTLAAPGTTGYATVELQGPYWLKFDWRAPSPALDFPQARASFGLYSGDRHNIYTH
jgi:MSHA biogenesis protein MshQ